MVKPSSPTNEFPILGFWYVSEITKKIIEHIFVKLTAIKSFSSLYVEGHVV